MIAKLRLASGLTIFTFVCCHLLNHVLGLISIEVMEEGRGYLLWFWRTLPGAMLFGTAAVVHLSIAVRSIYIRRTLRLPKWEWAQILLGLAIPPLLFKHLLGTRYLELASGVKVSYPLVLTVHWAVDPVSAIIQLTALIVAWTHACLGLHFWLRNKSWYAGWRKYVMVSAIMLPTLALAGYVAAGNRLLADLEAGTRSVPAIFSQAGLTPDISAGLQPIVVSGYVVIAVVFILPFVLRRVRDGVHKVSGRPTLNLPDGQKYDIMPGASVLEVLRAHRVPHPSICGGRARCTTCRVRVMEGLDRLPPAKGEEASALARIGVPESTRLACQIRPTISITVTPLLRPEAHADDGRCRGEFEGDESVVTCLFLDIRGWTSLSEQKLPYDVLFIINQFVTEMSEAVRGSNGHVSQFTGDGLMALYGLNSRNASEGARAALTSASEMLKRVGDLNTTLCSELPNELRIGIGIHTGPAIVGPMGPRGARNLTAIGDTINTTARLENLSKEYGAPLIVSRATAEAAALDFSSARMDSVIVRGREQPIEFFILEQAPTFAGPS